MTTMTVQAQAGSLVYHSFAPRGAAAQLFHCREPEVLISGPAGTGKSRACLEKLHLAALLNPGMRGLIVRKTQASLAGSALDTWRKAVTVLSDGSLDRNVWYYGGSSAEPAQYRYTNGSTVLLSGMDKSSKIMSTEFDLIYVQEATELTEEDWNALVSRLRNGVMSFQQIMADCNPQSEYHWLYQRCLAGQTRMLESRHEDNPVYFEAVDVTALDTVGPQYLYNPTDAGKAYLAKLDNLTGLARLRLRDGKWVSAEGTVYDNFDTRVHLIDEMPPGWESWSRYWAVDFGYTNPFTLQCWAEDPDGRLYLYRELYHTQRLVADLADQILNLVTEEKDGQRVWIEPKPSRIICDHDAEDRATFERALGLPTVAAKKSVSDGIQAVQQRLRVQSDGKARLYIRRNALVKRDQALADARKPTCLREEIPSYVWDPRKEAPVKENDHGCDAMRYMVAQRDLRGQYNIRWIS